MDLGLSQATSGGGRGPALSRANDPKAARGTAGVPGSYAAFQLCEPFMGKRDTG